jgi:hypothetical protein
MQTPAVLLTLLLLAACRPGGPTAVVHAAKGSVDVALEVAATDPARTQGLMYRTSLHEDRGMLFVFDTEVEHQFWMKNTLIPLDMLFIAGDGRIAGIHANATPLSLANITVGKPSRWVLEVAGGWAERHGVVAGDRVELRGVESR